MDGRASVTKDEERVLEVWKYGRLPEKLPLIELAAYANQTKLFSMNCNTNITIIIKK